MKKNTKMVKHTLEVKKIKAKLETTSLIALSAVLLILSTVQLAEAEVLAIEGSNEKAGIFIVIEGNENMIIWDTEDGYSNYFESKMKTYHTGAFSLKNPESGIALWAHPFSDTQYRILILTNEGAERIVGTVLGLDDIKTIDKPTDSDTVQSNSTEPNSSVGADITQYDIPTIGRSDHTYEAPIEVWNPDTLDLLLSVPLQIQWLYNMNFDLIAIDTKIASEQDQRLPNVPINVTILNPLMEIVGTWNGTTDNFGMFGDSYYIMDNQMVGEYTLEASASKENYTSVSKMVSFFVVPLDSSDSRKCPYGYMVNGTGFCECQLEFLNSTGFCKVQ